ncbi:MAG: alpha-amylase family glycosyl hydrolase [Saprospiraceae bacterium]
MNKIRLLYIIVFFLIFSCSEKKSKLKMHPEEKSIEWFQLLTLNPDTTKIVLSDYSLDNLKIDSIVYLNQPLPIVDGSIIITEQPTQPLTTIDIYSAGAKLSLPVKKSLKKKHTFKVNFPSNTYELVQIKGEMNAWNPNANPMVKNGGNYQTDFWLEDGVYQYKLMVDGKEISDPGNSAEISNGMGGTNSLWKIGNPSTEKIHISIDSFSDSEVHVVPNDVKIMAFWQNYQLKAKDGKLKIPKGSDIHERSYLRIWAMDDQSLSNEILIPLENGKIMNSSSGLNRSDWYAATIYNTFIDRFNNGKKENDWKNPEKDVLPKANYYGGDVVGVTQKIEDGYFDTLGINTIWISPVVKNPRGAFGKYPHPQTRFSAYHGYWPISFTQVDERLTTSEELKDMVKMAHKDHKNVLLDFIANHVHREHPYYQSDTTVATNLYLPDGSLNTERWDDHRLTTWFDVHMPSLDLTQPRVYETLSDSAVFWIEKYDFDGFRHDATKHVPNIFWETLTHKLKEKGLKTTDHPLYQLGETYGSAGLISSYLGNGLLDAQFDFNVYDTSVGALIGEKPMTALRDEIEKSMKYYGDHHLMGNITGNQDRARFISYASGDLLTSQDAKYEGWNRQVGIKDSSAYQSCAMLNAIISTIPGIPVIFYGDEIGIPGGNDPDNRKMMRFNHWNSQEKELFEDTAQLLHFRRQSMPLMYGDMNFIDVGKDYMVFERNYLDQWVRVVINNGKEDLKIELPERYQNGLKGGPIEKSMQVIKPLSYNIFYN